MVSTALGRGEWWGGFGVLVLLFLYFPPAVLTRADSDTVHAADGGPRRCSLLDTVHHHHSVSRGGSLSLLTLCSVVDCFLLTGAGYAVD